MRDFFSLVALCLVLAGSLISGYIVLATIHGLVFAHPVGYGEATGVVTECWDDGVFASTYECRLMQEGYVATRFTAHRDHEAAMREALARAVAAKKSVRVKYERRGAVWWWQGRTRSWATEVVPLASP